MDSRHGVFIVALIMYSQVAIGRSSNLRKLKPWENLEPDSHSLHNRSAHDSWKREDDTTKSERKEDGSEIPPEVLKAIFDDSTTEEGSTNTSKTVNSTLLIIEDCIHFCPHTSEYNPVCGTNNVTYRNLGLLACAQSCGVSVEVKRKSACARPITTESPDKVTTVSINGNKDENNTTKSERKEDGSEIPPEILKAIFDDPMTGEWSTNTSTTENSILLNIENCINLCPQTPEYNFVCGTNNVTYRNFGHLRCAQSCGVSVEIKKKSACVPPITAESPDKVTTVLINGNKDENNTTKSERKEDGSEIPPEILKAIFDDPMTGEWSTNTSTTENSILLNIENCINLCPQTPEYNFVCGTNNVTYRNLGHLRCAQSCGVSVDIKKKSACVPPITTESPDKVTTVSINGNKDENNTTKSKPKENGSEIPPEILKAIFDDSTTGEESTNTSLTVNSPLLDNIIEICINLCPRTAEYKPVCGTNNVTYRNLEHLRCAQSCGVTVEFKSKSACAPAFTTEGPEEINTVSSNGNKDENGRTEQGSSTIPPDVFNYPTITKSDNFDIDPRFKGQ